MWFKDIIPFIPCVLVYTLVLIGRIKRRTTTATKQMVCGTRLHTLETIETREKQHNQLTLLFGQKSHLSLSDLLASKLERTVKCYHAVPLKSKQPQFLW